MQIVYSPGFKVLKCLYSLFSGITLSYCSRESLGCIFSFVNANLMVSQTMRVLPVSQPLGKMDVCFVLFLFFARDIKLHIRWVMISFGTWLSSCGLFQWIWSASRRCTQTFFVLECNTTATQTLAADSIVWDFADTPWSVFWKRLPCSPLELFSLCLCLDSPACENTPHQPYTSSSFPPIPCLSWHHKHQVSKADSSQRVFV